MDKISIPQIKQKDFSLEKKAIPNEAKDDVIKDKIEISSTQEERITAAIRRTEGKLLKETQLLGAIGIGVATGSFLSQLITGNVLGGIAGPIIGALSAGLWEHFALTDKIKEHLPSWLKKKNKVAKASKVALEVKEASPRVLYPSIANVSGEERALIESTLDKLPLKDVTSVKNIVVGKTGDGILGITTAQPIGNNIVIKEELVKNASMAPITEHTIVHEVGHARDFGEGIADMVKRGQYSKSAPFGKPPYVTSPISDLPNKPYAATNRFEDFAVTYEYYHTNPQKVAREAPQKYSAMQKVEQPSLTDKLLDRPSVRKIGKTISQWIDKVPGLRLTLEYLGKISAPIALYGGARALQRGIENEDKVDKTKGKFTLAEGILLSNRSLALATLGLLGLEIYVNRKLKKGKISLEQADKVATTALAVSGGPVGVTAWAFLRNLPLVEHLPPEKEDLKLTKEDKKLIAKVAGGVVAGGIGGGIAGGTVGGVVGGVIGGVIAGPPGAITFGFLGKLIGSIGGAHLLANLGGKIARKLGRGGKVSEEASGGRELEDAQHNSTGN